MHGLLHRLSNDTVHAHRAHARLQQLGPTPQFGSLRPPLSQEEEEDDVSTASSTPLWGHGQVGQCWASETARADEEDEDEASAPPTSPHSPACCGSRFRG